MIQLLDSSDGDSAARATQLIRQREQPAFRQMLFDQLFTWPTDQPRHATDTYGDPVKSNRPPLCLVLRKPSSNNSSALTHPILSASRASSIGQSRPPTAGGPMAYSKLGQSWVPI